MARRFPALACLALTLCCSLLSSAGEPANKAKRPHISVPRATLTPRVDAALDDPAWAGAARIPALSIMFGSENKALTPTPTEVRLLWDANYLYVRFICTDNEIYSPLTGHDAPYYTADVVEIFLDPKGDSRQSIELEVSPNNGVLDDMFLCTAPRIKNRADLVLDDNIRKYDWWHDDRWNLDGFRTATSILKTERGAIGWLADLAIPARPTLKRTMSDTYHPMTLRANFIRYEYPPAPEGKKREMTPMNWSPTRTGCPHISPAAMGYLTLVETLPKAK